MTKDERIFADIHHTSRSSESLPGHVGPLITLSPAFTVEAKFPSRKQSLVARQKQRNKISKQVYCEYNNNNNK